MNAIWRETGFSLISDIMSAHFSTIFMVNRGWIYSHKPGSLSRTHMSQVVLV